MSFMPLSGIFLIIGDPPISGVYLELSTLQNLKEVFWIRIEWNKFICFWKD